MSRRDSNQVGKSVMWRGVKGAAASETPTPTLQSRCSVTVHAAWSRLLPITLVAHRTAIPSMGQGLGTACEPRSMRPVWGFQWLWSTAGQQLGRHGHCISFICCRQNTAYIMAGTKAKGLLLY